MLDRPGVIRRRNPPKVLANCFATICTRRRHQSAAPARCTLRSRYRGGAKHISAATLHVIIARLEFELIGRTRAVTHPRHPAARIIRAYKLRQQPIEAPGA